MRYHVTIGSRTVEVELGADGVSVEGRPIRVDLERVQGTDVRSLLLDGASHRVTARRVGAGTWDLHLGAHRYVAVAVDERQKAIRELAGTGATPAGPRPVRAPMPGLVVRVEVTEGDTVESGQGVVVVEAMKMENELRAEARGVVRRVHVARGDTVERDQLLIELASPDAVEAS